MKYEEIALNEALELSDAELETIVGGQRHGQEGHNGDWRRCHHRRNGGQGYNNIGYCGILYSGQGYDDQDCSGQGYSGILYSGQDCSGQGYNGQDYDGDDWQRRCRR